MTHDLLTTSISFPEIQLQTRDAHKLRGYFGNLFKEHSPLLHNHLEGGKHLYRYPLVQYKVINKTPMLTGYNEGADLLNQLFLQVKEIKIDDKTFPVYSKNIQHQKSCIGLVDDLNQYSYQTLWMGLNQENYRFYKNANQEERKEKLKKIAISNILAFFKAFNLKLEKEQRILLNLKVEERRTMFKNQEMTAFTGQFTCNALLPDYAGLGKSVSRGFGAIKRMN